MSDQLSQISVTNNLRKIDVERREHRVSHLWYESSKMI